jgi:hypothetical protein
VAVVVGGSVSFVWLVALVDGSGDDLRLPC